MVTRSPRCARTGLPTIDDRDVVDRAPSRRDRAPPAGGRARPPRWLRSRPRCSPSWPPRLSSGVCSSPATRRGVAHELDARYLDRARLGRVRIGVRAVVGAPRGGGHVVRRRGAGDRCGAARRAGRSGGRRRARVARRVSSAHRRSAGSPRSARCSPARYAVQVGPAIWTVWRTPSPTGVAAANWSLVGVEGALWCVYGLHHGDPAITSFGIIAMVAAAATLARKATTARAPTPPDEPEVRGPGLSTMSRITVP